MRRFKTNRKAVSPVIATVLMMLVVMAGMTILFAFVGTYASNYQAGSGSSVKELLTVEDVWFKNLDNLQVYMYNIGKVDMTINSVYVNGSKVDFTPNPLNIPMGQHNFITIDLNGDHYNNHYSVKIVTQRGSSFEGTYSP